MLTILLGLVSEIWHTFDDAALYILFGVAIAGLIQIFVDKDTIAKHLGTPSLKSVILAAIFGVPLPLCSCGVIPTAVSLRKNGASKGAVLSFLISTPESGLDSIAISYALLDPLMTIFRPIAAFITAIIAGISENAFGKKEQDAEIKQTNSCQCCGEEEHEHHNHGFVQRLRYGMHFAFVELLGDIAKWLTIGIVIGGIISYFVPQSFIENFLGSEWKAMLVMLAVGIPLYICASASTPIAAALIAKGYEPRSGSGISSLRPSHKYGYYISRWKIFGKKVGRNLFGINFGLCRKSGFAT